MSREELEFRFSQYLDGGLSHEERAQVDKLIAADPEARALFNEMRLIDDALKSSMALPPVRWDRLAESISSAVAEQEAEVRGGTMRLQPVDERLEHTIIRHVEGELSAQEQATLTEQLSANAAARETLAQHRSLDVMVKNGLPLPDLNWDRLQGALADQVVAHDALGRGDGASEAVDEEVERAITRYVAGELPEAEVAELETTLAGDAAARKLLAEHRSLDTVLKHAWPLPHVDWNRLQERLSDAVAAAEPAAAEPEPIRVNWAYSHVVRFAIAACVLIAVGIGAWIATHRPGPGTLAKDNRTPPGPVLQPTLQVAVMVPDDADSGVKVSVGAPAVAEVTFGPSDDYSRDRFDRYGGSGVVSVRPKVQLAGGASRVGAFLPY